MVSERTRTPADVAFDLRDSEALMLQTNLVAAAGAPSPYVTTADVAAYYQAHATELPSLPADPAERQIQWTKIEVAIRDRLADSHRERYLRAVTETD